MDSRMEQKVSLADMAASYYWADITNLVPDTCRTQAITRNEPMPTIGGTTCEWFCGMDSGINQHNLRIQQNQVSAAKVAIYACCYLCCCISYHRMDFTFCNQQQTY